MAGHILAGTPIAVDFWRIKSCPPNVCLFFLTHAHADHIEGLLPSWYHTIYCTPITKKLLLQKIQFQNENFIHELEVGESHVVQVDSTNTVTVTVIDANHCPGAAMFLFEGHFGRILYTGDFRYADRLHHDETFLTACTMPIDVLYIDNTFCDPRCCFPSRHDALRQIVDIIEQNSDARVMFGLRNLGKEDLVTHIARYFREPVGVDAQRFKMLELISSADVFQVSSDSKFSIVNWSEINMKNMDTWNSQCKTIAIIPTALETVIGNSSFCKHTLVYVVPYSDHSDFKELMEFVEVVEPGAVYPILDHRVKDRLSAVLTERHNMSCFNHLLRKPVQQQQHDDNVPTPAAVDDGTNSCPSLNHMIPSGLARKHTDAHQKGTTVNTSTTANKRAHNSIKKQYRFHKTNVAKGVVFTAESPMKQNHSAATTCLPDTTVHTELETKCDADCMTSVSEIHEPVDSTEAEEHDSTVLKCDTNDTVTLLGEPLWYISCLDEILSNEAAELVAIRQRKISCVNGV